MEVKGFKIMIANLDIQVYAHKEAKQEVRVLFQGHFLKEDLIISLQNKI